jgi:hypothetical protein
MVDYCNQMGTLQRIQQKDATDTNADISASIGLRNLKYMSSRLGPSH